MGVIKLARIISYSSQDSIFQCKNLLHNMVSNSSKPWLCARNDYSGRLEAEFQLDRPSKIHFIDIGNFGSCTIEVLVGKSSFQQSTTTYVSLLPAKTLLTLRDIRNEANTHSVFMFDKNDMSINNFEKEWDRVKIILCQPHEKRFQFGLAFLSLRNKDDNRRISLDDYNIKMPIIVDDSEEELTNNASIQKITTKPVIIEIIGEQFQNNVNNFLIACKEEGPRPLHVLIKEFEQQCKRNLLEAEKVFFQDKFKLFQKNLSSGFRPNDFIQLDGSQPSTSSGFNGGSFIQCPLCQKMFPKDEIERHAANC